MPPSVLSVMPAGKSERAARVFAPQKQRRVVLVHENGREGALADLLVFEILLL